MIRTPLSERKLHIWNKVRSQFDKSQKSDLSEKQTDCSYEPLPFAKFFVLDDTAHDIVDDFCFITEFQIKHCSIVSNELFNVPFLDEVERSPQAKGLGILLQLFNVALEKLVRQGLGSQYRNTEMTFIRETV